MLLLLGVSATKDKVAHKSAVTVHIEEAHCKKPQDIAGRFQGSRIKTASVLSQNIWSGVWMRLLCRARFYVYNDVCWTEL